jgi:[methyl-Co(III) methanol-specific corrinoid protein]:coenzyme M methyltransferase
MSLTPIQQVETILAGEDIGFFPNVIPINPPFLDVMTRAGVFWPEAHREPALMARLALATDDILGFNAVNVPFDMTVEAEALGCETVWKKEKTATPQVKDRALEDTGRLEFGDEVLSRGRFPVVLEAVKRLRDTKKNDAAIIPFIEGPFTVACLVAGLNEMFKGMIKDPERARWVLSRCTDLAVRYAKALLENGAHSIIVLDPNVMGLTAARFEEMILPCYEEMSGKIESNVILHICGDVGKILERIPDSGFAAFSFDYPAVSVQQVKAAVGARMKIIGSVPTVTHLLNGKPEEVFEVSTQMIKGGTDFLSPSCFIAPQTPLQNVLAMGEAVRSWNEK